MRPPSTLLAAAAAASLLSAAVLLPAGPADAATSTPAGRAAAKAAATWLADQVTKAGDIVGSSGPDLSDTALAPLALAATKTHASTTTAVVHYLEANAAAYVADGGHDGPGQLATLILDAKAAGVSPRKFGKLDLVTRLLATMRKTGAQRGLFGAQNPQYSGAYDQGLSLAALAAAGVRDTAAIRPAIAWLQHQQCANGGWQAFRASTAVACTPSDPSTYAGEDSNSTALAVEGLVAQHAVLKHSPLGFLASLEASSGGWGYYGGNADPDSTALVIQALVAVGTSVTATRWTKGGATPVGVLLSFKLSDGAFYYPTGSTKTPSLLATAQAAPALAGVAL